MRSPASLLAVATAFVGACAAPSRPVAPSPPAARATPTPAASPASKQCAASVTARESTAAHMALTIENRSPSPRSGTIRELRIMFTPARCPLSAESPDGWTASIEAQTSRHYCEVAWVTTAENGIPVGTKKDGFVVRFRSGKKEMPSWAVFLDACAVSGPAGPGTRGGASGRGGG